MSDEFKPCAECRMLCSPAEYHPYAACVLYKQLGQADKVKSCLDSVIEYATRADGDRYKQGIEDLFALLDKDEKGEWCFHSLSRDVAKFQQVIGRLAVLVHDAGIAPASPLTVPKCVLCGHNSAIDGICREALPRLKQHFGRKLCGCKCEFPAEGDTVPVEERK